MFKIAPEKCLRRRKKGLWQIRSITHLPSLSRSVIEGIVGTRAGFIADEGQESFPCGPSCVALIR